MRSDVQEVFKLTPHDKQVMMFSATLDKEVRPICKKFMTDVSFTRDGKASSLSWRCFCGDSGRGNVDSLSSFAEPIEGDATAAGEILRRRRRRRTAATRRERRRRGSGGACRRCRCGMKKRRSTNKRGALPPLLCDDDDDDQGRRRRRVPDGEALERERGKQKDQKERVEKP
jgi:hypothetical protein